MRAAHTSLEYWLSGEGLALLARASDALARHGGDTLRAGTDVRKYASSVYAGEALKIMLLRKKAHTKGLGSWTQNGFFTQQSLEQATAPAIAAHHAKRFTSCKHVLEICTGAGFDTAALARVLAMNGGLITSIEASAELAAMARHNLAAQGITNVEVVCGLAENVVPTLDVARFDGFWCDPSRRNEHGRRIENPNEYKPSLAWLQALPIRGVRGVKISPAANLSFPPHSSAYWREWIGFGDECREQVLWSGIAGVDGTATLVDKACAWFPPKNVSPVNVISAINGYLVEPHNSLIRSGHLAAFFAEWDVSLLDSHIAYGISQKKLPESPFYQTFRIVEAFPYNRKTLKQRVTAHGWGTRTEIKKRGFPDTPEQVRAWLKLKETQAFGVIFLTRTERGHLVILAEREG